ncbi:hypothetical protein EV363DRAFT_1298559 [Boletus edulis]|uniref:F-box domain-containing protein n=1 Tax=Boletus edulis BED1 TaxID=1328754 RepID=A0AAD4G5F5_BOLED|nr:hypothetical protein EV363DRAFT_1298559 [Boletus edulis]KAF8415890.1 hypothetical protein L210DRAFT_3656956 [Boletus edulis BED1]KAF8431757.1 hypothetical protein L210DRAFT_3507712 [Boletus edulis BED1]
MSYVPRKLTSRPNSSSCGTPIRALLIAEVLEMILDELVNEKRSICHLAFTCKAIAEPSLDRLWGLNDSLEPFIALLPKELVLDEDSVFRFDQLTISNLPAEKWATFDDYARRVRRLYAKTVTMNPHRIYSSIYKQLVHIRPNVELFPNLTTLAIHAKRLPNPHLRLFPSSLRSVTFSWANIKAPEIEAVLWSSVMNRLFLDAPLVEHIHFEGSPKEPLHSLTPLPFQQLQRITIKPSPLDPNVLHKYSHALSASAVRELDLRFVRWPDPRLQPVSPVFPSLRKLIIDGSPSHAIEFVRLLSSPVLQELAIASQCERSGDAMSQYTQLLMLLADKYRGVFRALKIQHPLLCHDQADLESFLRAVRTLTDAGVVTLQLNLIVGWQELTREVQDMIEPSKWTVPRRFRITSRRATPSWSWTAGNPLFG